MQDSVHPTPSKVLAVQTERYINKHTLHSNLCTYQWPYAPVIPWPGCRKCDPWSCLSGLGNAGCLWPHVQAPEKMCIPLWRKHEPVGGAEKSARFLIIPANAHRTPTPNGATRTGSPRFLLRVHQSPCESKSHSISQWLVVWSLATAVKAK